MSDLGSYVPPSVKHERDLSTRLFTGCSMFHARFGRQRRDGFDRRSIKLLSAGRRPHVPMFDGAVLTLQTGIGCNPAHSQGTGVPQVAATAAAHARGRVGVRRSARGDLGHRRGHHAGDGPDVPRQFPGHRGQDGVLVLAASAQIAHATTQSCLRLPGLVADRLRQMG